MEEDHSELDVEAGVRSGWAQLFAGRFLGLSAVVTLFGLGVGLVTFGFQLWIPTNLQKLGFSEVTSATTLRDSALLGFPATFIVAWLYGFWSSRKTMILLGLVTAASLAGFVLHGDRVAQHSTRLHLLLILPITGISSILAVFIAYASETFPTRVRSRGTGLAAGASKLGGVAIIALVVAGTTPPSIARTALIGAVPLVLGALAMAVFGSRPAAGAGGHHRRGAQPQPRPRRGLGGGSQFGRGGRLTWPPPGQAPMVISGRRGWPR